MGNSEVNFGPSRSFSPQVTIANYFKPGFVLPEDVPHLRSYLNHAFEDPVFKKFCPSVRKVFQSTAMENIYFMV